MILVAHTALAQMAGTGSVSGVVTDPTGAVIAQASVDLTNEATGVKQHTMTNSAGHYSFLNLVPSSTYTITVTHTGFQTAVRTGVIVQVASATALNIALETGTVTQSVTVSASGATLETESTDVGTVITPEMATSLPLSVGTSSMRDPTTFVFLTPNTSAAPSGVSSGFSSYQFSLGGGGAFGQAIYVDGTTELNPADNAAMAPGSIDAIREFKVLTSGLGAQYGNTTGGVESYITKSGTNQFHGSGYEIFRNEVLDANTWFNNGYAAQNPAKASVYRRPPDKKNEYGVTLGGPVWIPKIYNGKNKTFFFFSWEQFRQKLSVVQTTTLPTMAMRQGDFSAIPLGPALGTNPCNGQTIYQGQIFDPATTRSVGGRLCRDPFPGNIIPSNRFSAVAQNILKYVPQPTNNNLSLNYSWAAPSSFVDTTDSIRIDHQFSPEDNFFFTYIPFQQVLRKMPSLPDPLDAASDIQNLTVHHYRIGYTHTFSPTSINSFRFGYSRYTNLIGPYSAFDGKNWPMVLGFQNGPQGNPFPSIRVSDMAGMGFSFVYNDWQDLYYAEDSLTFIRGKHTITLGGAAQFSKEAQDFNFALTGVYNITRAATSASQTASTSGYGVASFLIGGVNYAYASGQAQFPTRLYDYGAAYIQDEWKPTRSLFISAGLRYDVPVPFRNAINNANSNFSPDIPNPRAGGRPGALYFTGTMPKNYTGVGSTNGQSSRLMDTYYKDFGPRLGIAWTPDFLHQQTVFHGYYGVLYAPMISNINFPGPAGYGSTAFVEDFATGGFNPVYLDNSLPAPSTKPNFDPGQLVNSSANWVKRSFGRVGMMQEWSAEVQQMLAPDLILTLGYMGNHGTHLQSHYLFYPDALDPKYYNMGANLNQTVNGANAPYPYPGFSGTVARSLLPYPQYTSIFAPGENLGQSYYHSMYATLQRQFGNGLSLLVSYTWSKAESLAADSLFPGSGYGNPGIQNPFNRKGEKSIAALDTPQHLTISYIYNLPFGKGQRYLNEGGIVNALIGNWQVSGIQTYHSGAPAYDLGGCATSIPGLNTCIRYNAVPGQQLHSAAWKNGHFNPLTSGSALNPLYFQDPNAPQIINAGGGYTFGNLPRISGDLRSGFFSQEDFAVQKTLIQFHESNRLDFRMESFNTFNRHVFGMPDTTVTSPTFGIISGTNDSPRQMQATLRYSF
ncbi:MAG TPA: carboxypeptidase-like regulatory domain-containing protein [Alloacidobacterium sp.]|nr:carboxypeptidase-like regulatory domain-containing protein [Alloacidobacterium sp.]